MILKKKKIIMLCLITILFVVQNVNLEAVLGTNLVEAAAVSMNRSSLNLLVGNSYTLKMNGASKKGKWDSANKKIATVDSNGKVTALKAGKTDIYVLINSKKYICKLTVKNPVLNHKTLSLVIGDNRELRLEGTKGKIKWKSQKPSIASVNSKGIVTAKAPGKVNITANIGNSTYVCIVTVNKVEPKYIELVLEDDNLYQGESVQIKTELYPTYATIDSMVFKSSDETIARVNQDGFITAVNPGTVTITGISDKGVTAECTIEVVLKPILSVNKVTIQLDESKETIIDRLGSPTRIGTSNYGDETYVYANDYNKLLFIYMKENKVVGFYTNADDFEFAGVNKETEGSPKPRWNKKYIYDFFVDKIGSNKVYGIFLIETSISVNEFTDEILINMEREIFDITNSYRAHNSLPPLVWSDIAAVCARKHSGDMAKNDYFSHTSLTGLSPFDRMEEEGITYVYAGENIAAGYRTSFGASHGWLQSSGHRSAMLESRFAHLGVGIAVGGSYDIYLTQNFYTSW